MKKTFSLTAPGKADARVVEAVKNEVRKYVKRERRKTLPEGFDAWTFTCRAGPNHDDATACELPDLSAAIDAVVNSGGKDVYIEILATPGPGHRSPPSSSPANA